MVDESKREIHMRKVVFSMFISLDGVVEDPAWTTPYWNDEIVIFKLNGLFSTDILLLGRTTYPGERLFTEGAKTTKTCRNEAIQLRGVAVQLRNCRLITSSLNT
jgi:hypothetical protein